MSVALFRADGSQHLGIGHIRRCTAFARGLEEVDIMSVFVAKDYDQKTNELIQRYGYKVETIPRTCNFGEDSSLTLKFAREHNASLVVTDLCNVDTLGQLAEYRRCLQELKNAVKFLITIDDLNAILFPSDIVINPNCGAEMMPYDFNQYTKYLLGPEYFIFHQEFREAAKANRKIRKYARNILVTMGGSDLLNLTPRVTKAVSKLEEVTDLNLCIVLGPGYPDSMKREIENNLKDSSITYRLMQGTDNMAELMLWSDLAITGGGLTKYEAAVTGTPSIIISQVAHQAELAKEFEKEGTALNLGLGTEVSEENIARAAGNLLRDYTLRIEMSKRGKGLVDGKGVERIISSIPQEV